MDNNCNNCIGQNHVSLILKIADYCNFTCDFCRYPNNPHKSLMTILTFKTIVEKACDYNINAGNYHLDIVFHGGEPLLWGYNNFVEAIEFENEMVKRHPGLIIENSIQTNGSLLNDKWIDFFQKNNFDIGISIDGPEEINFHKGPLGSRDVLENIHKMSQKNCRFGILSVITNEHEGWADKYYDFLVEHNIHSVGLCYCMYDDKRKITVNNNILTDFLRQFFDRYFNGQYQLQVREFSNFFKNYLGLRTGSCSFSKRQKCGNFFSIRPNGDVFFCDPYTLDGSPLGNIRKETFFDIKKSPELQRIVSLAKDGYRKACSNCEVKSICGGGCYRTTLSDGSSAFCDTFKSLYPYLETIVRPYKHNESNGSSDICKDRV